ncbi:lysis protein, partial [Ectopseudomonas toyotomiensis]
MNNVIGWIADHWYVPIFVALMYLMWAYGESQYDLGHSTAQAKGDKALADLREEHQKLRADAAEQNLVL